MKQIYSIYHRNTLRRDSKCSGIHEALGGSAAELGSRCFFFFFSPELAKFRSLFQFPGRNTFLVPFRSSSKDGKLWGMGNITAWRLVQGPLELGGGGAWVGMSCQGRHPEIMTTGWLVSSCSVARLRHQLWFPIAVS